MASQGALVMIPSLALSLSSHNYGPDTLSFKPDRWISSNDTTSSTEGALPPAAPAAKKPETQAATAGDADTAAHKDNDSSLSQGDVSSRSSSAVGALPPDPYTFMAGPRDCIGQSLAKLELQVRALHMQMYLTSTFQVI